MSADTREPRVSLAARTRVIEHAEGFSCELSGGGRALFSSRAHGNLSTQRGVAPERGRATRERLCGALGLSWLCASRQVHGTSVQRVQRVHELGGSGGEATPIDADGHATALAGVGVMVLTADCLPIALGAQGAVAVVHAGWRGLADGVVEQGVRALRELRPDGPIAAVVGPGAGVCCYEVGPEVHAAFGLASAGVGHRRTRNIDLRAIARERLLGAGVAEVQDAEACTICDERFFSHRRQREQAGRQAGVAWLG